MTNPPTVYRAYLLRLWHTADGCWRASLETTQTGERLAFATLEQLAAYLADDSELPPASLRLGEEE